MKVLYIAHGDILAPDLALRIKNEGNDVAFSLDDEEGNDVLKRTIKRIPYDNRLEYAKSCDLVIYDSGCDNEPSGLRKQGLSVIGGDKKTEQLETDRVKANNLAEACGMLVPKIHPVKNLKEAKQFIEKTGGKWVLKQMGELNVIKGLNIVAKMDNSEDVVSTIDRLIEIWPDGLKQEFVLQEKVEGHEMACGSFWNGKEFQKDGDGDEICEINWEHKPLMAGNMGEATGEMYTILKMVKGKYCKLFQETLDKVRPLLKKIDYRGAFDINCIINEKGAYFLEFTPRIGVPIISGLIAVQKTPWGEFLKAMTDGKQIKYEYNNGYCIVAWLLTKPFPARSSKKVQEMAESILGNKKDENSIAELMSYKLSDSYGIPVLFKDKLSSDELGNLHFDAVMMDKGQLKISNHEGYVLTVTGIASTVNEAADKVEALLKKIVVPKGFWRNDFKQSNYHSSRNDLIDWGYLDEEKDEDEISAIKKQIKEVLKK